MSSLGSRPVSWAPRNRPIAIGVPNTSVNVWSRSWPVQGASISSISWPSEASSSAASRDGALAERVERRVDRGGGRHPDAQASRLARRGRRERLGGRGRPGRVAGLVAGDHVEQQGRVRDAAGQHAVLDEVVVAEVGTARHAAAARLQPDQAAARRRDPDRPAAVAAVGERNHPGRHGGRGAARGAARRALGVPGIARRAEAARLGHGQDPELGQVGLPDDHEARLAQPAHDEGVVARDEVAEGVRAQRVRHAGDRGGVLDRDRHAGERPRIARADRVGGRQRPLGIEVHERVELAVERLDPPQRGLGQLARAELAAPNELGELAGRPEEQLGVHGARAYRAASAGGERRGAGRFMGSDEPGK